MERFKDREVNIDERDLKEVDTTREPISMVFIGHVDAGNQLFLEILCISWELSMQGPLKNIKLKLRIKAVTLGGLRMLWM
jgi:hypothetical protein